MARVDDGDRLVQELVKLAQRELTGDPPRTTVRVLPDLRRRPAFGAWRPWAWALGGLGAAAALVVFLLLGRPAPITYDVVNGAVVAGAVVGSEGTRLRFSDGSEVALERDAETRVASLDQHGATLRLTKGRARVAVTPRRGAAWVVQAGPYSVRVTGTEFDVGWNATDHSLDVAMRSGSVEVIGGSLPAPIRLRAGQRLLRRGLEPPRVIDGLEASVARDTAAPESPNPRASAPENENGARLPENGARPPVDGKASEISWSRRVAQGKFDEVLADAERQGIDAVIARAPLADLMALGDAARYARRAALAERVLLAVRQRFKGSGAARDAAFLLGQLAESRGGAALTWYEAYLREAPNGAYASQALGRKMIMTYQDRGAAAAEAIASQYVMRYPKGPYVAAARKIVSEASGRQGP